MRQLLTQSRLSLRPLTCLALVFVLGGQVLESSHLHSSGLETPDCLQCLYEPGQALSASQPLLAAPAPETSPPLRDITAIGDITLLPYLARGPPTFSS